MGLAAPVALPPVPAPPGPGWRQAASGTAGARAQLQARLPPGASPSVSVDCQIFMPARVWLAIPTQPAGGATGGTASSSQTCCPCCPTAPPPQCRVPARLTEGQTRNQSRTPHMPSLWSTLRSTGHAAERVSSKQTTFSRQSSETQILPYEIPQSSKTNRARYILDNLS